MGFSEKQEVLVKESWELMKENIPEFSFRFFTLYANCAYTQIHSTHSACLSLEECVWIYVKGVMF